MRAFVALSCSVLIYFAKAHPGPQKNPEEMRTPAQEMVHQRAKRALNNCMNARTVRSLHEHAALRRQAWADEIRLDRMESLSRVKRDQATILATNHQSSAQLTSSSNPFTGNSSCLLDQEGEIGPYWVKGEFIRADVREGQAGIELFLDIQIIDVNTCQPVPNIYLDIWSCNSTGVYGGVQANNNGNFNDLSNLNATFLRGLQPTGSNGVAKFTTIFPGHYSGRTNHVHVVAHLNGTVLPNNTYTSGTIPHIGQILFDQSLINTIEATSPYNTNTQQVTPNAQDRVVGEETGTTSDPFLDCVMLGSTVSSGLLGWITLGINVTVDNSGASSYAATLTAAGGVANSNAGGGGLTGAGCGGPGQGGQNGYNAGGNQGGSGGAGPGGAPPNGTGPGNMGGNFGPPNCSQNGTGASVAPVSGGTTIASGTVAGAGVTPAPGNAPTVASSPNSSPVSSYYG